MSLLEIENLDVKYQTIEGDVSAVHDVNLSVGEGETVGIVGESGSGKSTLVKSIIRTLDDNGRIDNGAIKYDGADLTRLSNEELREYKWEEIAYIPQSAMNALDPVYTIESQIIEVIQSHRKTPKDKARERAKELFQLVGLEEDRLSDYPHQFSGGMKQRAMIALALALEPKILIADEPTTALDVITQRTVLDNIADIQSELDISILLVTHDISVVSERCEKIAVFYGGRIVEYAETETIMNNPRHPYTLGLRNAFPSLFGAKQSLTSIPGKPPNLIDPGDKCRFTDRCPFAKQECYEALPELAEIENGHLVDCIRAQEQNTIQQAMNPQLWKEEAND
jgi:peptide/nickel transport system ATP-binding protein